MELQVVTTSVNLVVLLGDISCKMLVIWISSVPDCYIVYSNKARKKMKMECVS